MIGSYTNRIKEKKSFITSCNSFIKIIHIWRMDVAFVLNQHEDTKIEIIFTRKRCKMAEKLFKLDYDSVYVTL